MRGRGGCLVSTSTYQEKEALNNNNPFPAKAFVLLVKVAPENSLSEKFCLPAVFTLKTLLRFGLHKNFY